jgi:hypothetical protein
MLGNVIGDRLTGNRAFGVGPDDTHVGLRTEPQQHRAADRTGEPRRRLGGRQGNRGFEQFGRPRRPRTHEGMFVLDVGVQADNRVIVDHPASLVLEDLHDIDEIIVRMPTPEEIERLDIPPGTPVAEHIRTGYTRTDVAVRVMISIIPGDTMIFEYKIPT